MATRTRTLGRTGARRSPPARHGWRPGRRWGRGCAGSRSRSRPRSGTGHPAWRGRPWPAPPSGGCGQPGRLRPSRRLSVVDIGLGASHFPERQTRGAGWTAAATYRPRPEGCQSGRMGRPRKPLRSSGLRGFESHSFRRDKAPGGGTWLLVDRPIHLLTVIVTPVAALELVRTSGPCHITPSRTSTHEAYGAFRSTTSRTSATPWPGSARSGSRTTPLGSGPGRRLLQRGAAVSGSCRSGSSPTSCEVAQRACVLPGRAARRGFVTMLMTDVEGSTALVQRLGPRFGALIDDVWAAHRVAVAERRRPRGRGSGGRVLRGVRGAASGHRRRRRHAARLREQSFVDGTAVRVRVGIHSGYPTLTAGNYVGVDVNASVADHARSATAARSSASAATTRSRAGDEWSRDAVRRPRYPTSSVVSPRRRRSSRIASKGLPTRFPPLRT